MKASNIEQKKYRLVVVIAMAYFHWFTVTTVQEGVTSYIVTETSPTHFFTINNLLLFFNSKPEFFLIYLQRWLWELARKGRPHKKVSQNPLLCCRTFRIGHKWLSTRYGCFRTGRCIPLLLLLHIRRERGTPWTAGSKPRREKWKIIQQNW